MLPDFLYSQLKIRDIERVMVLIEGNDSYALKQNGYALGI